MNHEIYDLMLNHKSIRSYQNKKVSEDVLSRILNAATRASSSGNMQAYSIIVTEDENLKQELLAPHFYQSMVTEAPVLLTFCADFYRMREWLKISEAPENFDNLMSFMIASIDAILASQNAALAAEAEGLGICYMGTTLASAAEIAKILKCPPNVIPVVGFSLGYPNEKPLVRDRLPIEGIVHREVYRTPNVQALRDTYHEKEQAGMKRYQENSELKKRIDEVGAENLAQVYTKAKYTRESHLKYSKDLFNFLKDQNFLNFE
ncbi:nitroreductase family protein [Pseudobdellovibrio sp. HCB154]|uniref:nitroreductase family protein n=1 Tax=Pseudobdellovibrio sp. HCB154 TaxID=3386277 RepID=UPI0039172699